MTEFMNTCGPWSMKLYLNYKVEYRLINMPHIHSNFLLLIKITPNNAFDSMFHQQTLHIDNLQKHITFDLCTLAPTTRTYANLN